MPCTEYIGFAPAKLWAHWARDASELRATRQENTERLERSTGLRDPHGAMGFQARRRRKNDGRTPRTSDCFFGGAEPGGKSHGRGQEPTGSDPPTVMEVDGTAGSCWSKKTVWLEGHVSLPCLLEGNAA